MSDSKPIIDSVGAGNLSMMVTTWAFVQAGFGLLFIALRVLDIPHVGFERLPLVFMGVPH